MNDPRQGEVWWAEAEDRRRPVLIVTRSEAIPVLRRLVVAPVTRTVRGIPTEVALGSGEGMRVECVASFDNLQPINRRMLTQRIGAIAANRRDELRSALDALADC